MRGGGFFGMVRGRTQMGNRVRRGDGRSLATLQAAGVGARGRGSLAQGGGVVFLPTRGGWMWRGMCGSGYRRRGNTGLKACALCWRPYRPREWGRNWGTRGRSRFQTRAVGRGEVGDERVWKRKGQTRGVNPVWPLGVETNELLGVAALHRSSHRRGLGRAGAQADRRDGESDDGDESHVLNFPSFL